jgi:hypothetical protein
MYSILQLLKGEYSSIAPISSLQLKRDNESKPDKIWFKSMLRSNILHENLPDTSHRRPGFHVSSLLYLTKNLQRVNVNIYANTRNEYITTEHFPPSVVIWVNLTYTLLSCGLVDSASSSNLSGSAWRKKRPPEKRQAFTAEDLNGFQEAMK